MKGLINGTLRLQDIKFHQGKKYAEIEALLDKKLKGFEKQSYEFERMVPSVRTMCANMKTARKQR